MKVPEDVQFVYRNGEPLYAVVPYKDYLEYVRHMNALAVLPARPAPVLSPSGLSSSLMASWRRLQGISQAELAQRLGIAEEEVVRLESLRMGSVGR